MMANSQWFWNLSGDLASNDLCLPVHFWRTIIAVNYLNMTPNLDLGKEMLVQEVDGILGILDLPSETRLKTLNWQLVFVLRSGGRECSRQIEPNNILLLTAVPDLKSDVKGNLADALDRMQYTSIIIIFIRFREQKQSSWSFITLRADYNR